MAVSTWLVTVFTGIPRSCCGPSGTTALTETAARIARRGRTAVNTSEIRENKHISNKQYFYCLISSFFCQPLDWPGFGCARLNVFTTMVKPARSMHSMTGLCRYIVEIVWNVCNQSCLAILLIFKSQIFAWLLCSINGLKAFCNHL